MIDCLACDASAGNFFEDVVGGRGPDQGFELIIDCLGSSILAVGGIAVTAVFIASTGGLALAFATPFALFGVVLALDACAKQYS